MHVLLIQVALGVAAAIGYYLYISLVLAFIKPKGLAFMVMTLPLWALLRFDFTYVRSGPAFEHLDTYLNLGMFASTQVHLMRRLKK
jgi:hypothetical protein